MGQTAKAPRQNRTITVDFQDPSTYFELLSNGKAFVEFVLAFILSIGFQLVHKATCTGGGCLTRHSHYARVRLGGLTIWRIQCTLCRAVFTVLPHSVIGFNRACQLAFHLIREGSIAQPPAPAIAGADMHPGLSGDAPRRARQTEQEGGQNPMRQRSLALMHQGTGEVIEGALAVAAAVALTPGAMVIIAPGPNIVTLAPGTLQRRVFPA